LLSGLYLLHVPENANPRYLLLLPGLGHDVQLQLPRRLIRPRPKAHGRTNRLVSGHDQIRGLSHGSIPPIDTVERFIAGSSPHLSGDIALLTLLTVMTRVEVLTKVRQTGHIL